MKGYMYILLCSDGSYYTGSTNNLELRLQQHQNGEGANHTKKHLPIELVYYEEFQRIDEAFYREKQVQGWSRKKKEALIAGTTNKLHQLAECKNDSHYMNAPVYAGNVPFDSAQGTGDGSGNVPFDSAQGTERVERSQKVVERSQKVVERSQKVVERSRKVVERSRKVVERSRNHRNNGGAA